VVRMEAGQAYALAKGVAVCAATEPLWVRFSSGRARWMDKPSLPPLGPEAPGFPLTAHTPLCILETSSVCGWTTARWLAESSALEISAGLARFDGHVRAVLRERMQEEERTAWARLEEKRRQDDDYMRRALRQLAAAAEPAGRSVPVADGNGDLLFEVCRLVGEAAGIALQMPKTEGRRRGGEQIAEIAKTSRVRYRRVMLKGEWWKEDNGPLLAFWEEPRRPVALLPRGYRRYELVDLAERRSFAVTAEVAERLEPQAVMFYRPLPSRPLSLPDIVRFVLQGDVKQDLALLFVMGVMGGLFGMAIPLATGQLFDRIIPEAEYGKLGHMALLLTGIIIAMFCFELVRSLALLRIEGKMNASLQAAVWDRLLSLPVPFFRRYTAGDLAMRANSINAMRQIISGTTVTAIFTGIFSLFNFFLLFYLSRNLAAYAALLVAVAVAFALTFSFVPLNIQRRLAEKEGKLAGFVLQIIRGIAKFRVAGAERRAFYLWAKEFSEQRRLAYRAGTWANGQAAFNAAFPVLASLALFAVAAADAALSPGMFLAFYAAFTNFILAMMDMSMALMTAMHVIPLYERAKPILQAEPEVDEAKADPGPLHGEIEVSHVSFRYGDEGPYILQDITFHVKPGEFVAIVGPSGSGKSTLFRLLLGFEKPQVGRIYYDGQDLNGLDVRRVRSQMGVVLQNGQLMPGDIFSNIVGSANLTLQDAWEAARMVGLDEDIREMPMQMFTMVSEGAGTLSGGQRQRLLLARAVVHRPRILLLDEATSALDNETQAIVAASLEQLQATRIVIAHRLSTVRHADKILVLDKGRIVQSGTFEELMNSEGLFRRLAERQIG